VSELVPELAMVTAQVPDPLTRLPVQLPPVELLTFTVPVGAGVPVEGAFAPTWKLTVMVCPATAVFWGEFTVVEVEACVTARLAEALLGRKLVSPA